MITSAGISTQTPPIAASKPVRLTEAGPALWRVVDRRGIVIGHLQAILEGDATRYRARRLRTASHAFFDLGEFWRADDAIDCLRFTR